MEGNEENTNVETTEEVVIGDTAEETVSAADDSTVTPEIVEEDNTTEPGVEVTTE